MNMPFKQVLHEQDTQVTHVYFLITGVYSLITILADGDVVEGGSVGFAGAVGAAAIPPPD
jgi:hypothetical protein